MRLGAAISVGCLVWAAVGAPAFAQNRPCPNPNALGVARTVEVDTTGGPGFGFEQYKAHDFLVLKEVVLTFDDGPWPNNTRAVLEALAQHCTKAVFFPIGKHALWHPEILKEVAAAGHTIGGHTWSHANLAGASKSWPKRVEKGQAAAPSNESKAVEEIEKGFSAIKLALGAAPSPFFRFPYLKDPKEAVEYLGTRGIAIFSHDLDSFDFKKGKPEDVVKSVMGKLEKKGKGIVLMHDFQQHTAKALPDLLNQLKAGGYKVVHMRAKAPLQTLAAWDEAAKAEIKGPTGGDRPTSSVIRTIEEAPASAVTAGTGGQAK
ncbi:MAG TPA: polysaccharide deacetylase family protein [Hyphomicrobiaceae bacterium]|nr:polysaccharide deacetylase family protein [Hyphomicrobiaceae bacterium]